MLPGKHQEAEAHCHQQHIKDPRHVVNVQFTAHHLTDKERKGKGYGRTGKCIYYQQEPKILTTASATPQSPGRLAYSVGFKILQYVNLFSSYSQNL